MIPLVSLHTGVAIWVREQFYVVGRKYLYACHSNLHDFAKKNYTKSRTCVKGNNINYKHYHIHYRHISLLRNPFSGARMQPVVCAVPRVRNVYFTDWVVYRRLHWSGTARYTIGPMENGHRNVNWMCTDKSAKTQMLQSVRVGPFHWSLL